MTVCEVFIRCVVDLKWDLDTFVNCKHSVWVSRMACSLKQRHINERSLIKPPSIDISPELVSVVGHDLFNIRLLQILPTICVWVAICICYICTPSVECWRTLGRKVIIVRELKSGWITFVNVILQLQECWACAHVLEVISLRKWYYGAVNSTWGTPSDTVNAPCPAMYTMTFNPSPWMASRSSLNRSLPVGLGVASVLLRLHNNGWWERYTSPPCAGPDRLTIIHPGLPLIVRSCLMKAFTSYVSHVGASVWIL